jgi:hypothetical protein
MKALARDSWLAIGLFVILALITVAAAIQQTRNQTPPPLASFSTAPDGAQALWLWLDELGYPASNDVLPVFRPPAEAGLMLMLEPFPGITPAEWEVIDEWVDEGGTLLLAGDQLGAVFAARHYQANLTYLEPSTATLVSQTPLFVSPPAGPAEVQTRAYFETTRTDFVTHLAVESGPVLLSFARGQGQVFLSAAPFPLTNAGLKEDGNPALVLNLLSAVEQPVLIWFDEWHHGLRSTRTQVAGPGDWLRYTPAGRSLLLVAGVIFAALVLKGRRFGRPVPLAKDTARRAPLEYITAIANLNRRAGHRAAVLKQYHYWLKRNMGQRYRLNPTLPDEEYLAHLARLKPNLDIAALRALLTRLNRPQASESDMIQLAAETAEWLKES